METKRTKQQWLEKDRENKEIPTVAAAAKYTGDFRTVAAQAKAQKPDDPEAVIARNTSRTVCSRQR